MKDWNKKKSGGNFKKYVGYNDLDKSSCYLVILGYVFLVVGILFVDDFLVVFFFCKDLDKIKESFLVLIVVDKRFDRRFDLVFLFYVKWVLLICFFLE